MNIISNILMKGNLSKLSKLVIGIPYFRCIKIIVTYDFYNNTIYLLDEFAPYRKLTKKEFKLKSKPWISNEILTKIHERDKLLYKYSNAKDLNRNINLFKDYKILRHTITRMKRDVRSKCYKE